MKVILPVVIIVMFARNPNQFRSVFRWPSYKQGIPDLLDKGRGLIRVTRKQTHAWVARPRASPSMKVPTFMINVPM